MRSLKTFDWNYEISAGTLDEKLDKFKEQFLAGVLKESF